MRTFALLTYFLISISSFSQLIIDPSVPANTLVQNYLMGGGVTVSNVVYSGGSESLGYFTNGATTNLGFDKGIILSTGRVIDAANNVSAFTSFYTNSGGDNDIAAIASGIVYDATSLSFDVISYSSQIVIRYIFASEEYPEYVCSNFNDAFAFFISGPSPLGGNYNNTNIAIVPSTLLPVAINSINPGVAGANSGGGACSSLAFSYLYVDNQALNGNVAYDGFTTILTAVIDVIPCQSYHLKLVVADVADGSFDSAIFLEEGSISSNIGVSVTTGVVNPSISSYPIESCNNPVVTLSLPIVTQIDKTYTYTVTGTATPGVDYTPLSGSITIPAGQSTVSFPINTIADGITEGDETIILNFNIPPCGELPITITLTDAGALQTSMPDTLNVCAGDLVMLNASASGGVPPYSYLWSDGLGNTSSVQATASSSETYYVTITDICAIPSIDSIYVDAPPCGGECYAYAGIDDKVCGLTYYLQTTYQPGDHDFLWTCSSPGVVIDNPTSSATWVTVPALGMYEFTWHIASITNDTCSDSKLVTFEPNPIASFSADSIACNGDFCTINYNGQALDNLMFYYDFNNAFIQSGSGGGPYEVSWSNTGNNYVSLYVERLGCFSDTLVVFINNPPILNAEVTVTDITCANSNETAVEIIASGGTPTYTYTWSSGSVPPTQTGVYSVTVTDQHNCTFSTDFSLTSPDPLVNFIDKSNPLCFGDLTGSISIFTSGGTPPYSYSWSNNPLVTTSSQSNLPAGTYQITVTDGNQCETIIYDTITQPQLLQAQNPSTIAPLCNGGSNGSISITAMGGIAPYQFSIGNGTQGTGAFVNLQAGTYNVSITDYNNCSIEYAIVLNEPSPLQITNDTVSNVLCFGSNTGEITVQATGGTGTLNYTIGGLNQNTGTFPNLYAGTYTVQISDANNCILGNIYSISQPSVLQATDLHLTHLLCYGINEGALTLNASGGVPPYMFSVNGISQTTGNFQGLAAGAYTVLVTDSNNCQANVTATLTQPEELTIEILNVTNIPCFGNTASITVTGSGGIVPYTFSNNGQSQTTGFFYGLSDGNYQIALSDQNGCSVQAGPIFIDEPEKLIFDSLIISNVNCFNAADGELSVFVSGGVPPMTYTLFPMPGQTLNHFENLTNGNYYVRVSDANACFVDSFFTITQPPALNASVYPQHVSCFGGNDGAISVNAFGGIAPYQYQWNINDTGSSISNLTAGAYELTVTDQNNCEKVFQQIITEPEAIMLNVSPDRLICAGDTARFIATATGGHLPYTYYWNNLQGIDTFSLQTSANIPVEIFITDGNNCISDTITRNINVYPLPSFNVYADKDTFCAGDSALISCQTSDGLTYTMNNQTTISFPVQIAPTESVAYVFSAKDHCNISVYDTLFFHVVPKPSVAFVADVYKGCVPLVVNFLEGSDQPGVSYNWSFEHNNAISSQQNPVHVFDSPGIFDVTLTVTSANNCSSTLLFSNMIEAYPLPDAHFLFDPLSASILNPQIEFTNYSTENCSNYWYFGDGDSSEMIHPLHLYHEPGTYNVMLVTKTAFGCTDTSTAQIVIRDEFAFYAPTAFSPDLNSLNENFHVFGTGIDPNNFHLRVFDRWGFLVFETEDMNQGWDGRSGNDYLKTGTYTWYVEYKAINGKNFTKSGPVTLIR